MPLSVSCLLEIHYVTLNGFIDDYTGTRQASHSASVFLLVLHMAGVMVLAFTLFTVREHTKKPQVRALLGSVIAPFKHGM